VLSWEGGGEGVRGLY